MRDLSCLTALITIVACVAGTLAMAAYVWIAPAEWLLAVALGGPVLGFALYVLYSHTWS